MSVHQLAGPWNRPSLAFAVGFAGLVLATMTLLTVWFGGTNLTRTQTSSAAGQLRLVPEKELAGNGWDVLPNHGSVGYYRSNSRVYLHGVLHAHFFERIPVQSTVFRLPLGYRPRIRLIFVVPLNGLTGRLEILPAGNVVAVVPSGYAASLSLEDVNFYIG